VPVSNVGPAIADAIRSAASHAAATRAKGRHASEIAAQFTPLIALNAYEGVIDRLLAYDEAISLQPVGSPSVQA
jgi:hypothetical protein